MGKGRSPAKWFKSLLGKKSSSKSNSSKKNDIFVSESDPTADSLLISAPISGGNANNGVLSEKNVSTHDRDILTTGGEDTRTQQAVGNFGPQEDLENLKLTEAAIKVQAACRGYQARQTFEMHKGIIQLQALIRGHLVRRQAVSALYCVKGIVKVQALARGYIVRNSDIGLAVLKICKDTRCTNSVQAITSTQAEKLSESVFVHKLLASSGTAVPLSLSCVPREPNLACPWLDRWTRSRFWAPLPEPKKKLDLVSEKNGSSHTVKRRQVKRTTQKSPTVKADDGSNKFKQRPKKDSNSPSLSAKEKEIEKNSSKKNRSHNVSDKSEVTTEKRKTSTKKTSDHTAADVSEQGASASSEKKKSLAAPKSKESDPEKVLGLQEDKQDNEQHSLKKARTQNVANKSEGVNEKRKHSTRKIADHIVTDASEQGTSASSEIKKDLTVSKSKESDHEKNPEQQQEKQDNKPNSPEITSVQNVADSSEVVNEKRKHNTRKFSDHTVVTDVSEQGPNLSTEKKKVSSVSKSEESDSEKSPGQQQVDKHDNEPNSPRKTHFHNVADSSEVVNEKREHIAGNISDHMVTDVSEQETIASSEKKKDSAASKSKESDPEKSLGPQAEDNIKHANGPDNHVISDLQTSTTNGGNKGIRVVGEDLDGGGGSCISNNCQRRASLPAIFNGQDNESHSTPRLPSYMAPTESAKARVRGQGSPRLATDLLDKNSLTRRHSLSSSFNGKSGSFSPRTERLVAMSGRGAIRNDRSLSSSRDGTDKAIQPQWRR